MVTIGYARASTDDQELDRQLKQLIDAGVPEHLIYRDAATSGKKPVENRAGYRQLSKMVETGTVEAIYVTDLSRLGRDAKATLKEVWALQDKGIKVISLNSNDQSITTADPVLQPLLYSAFSLGADLQRQRISEDTRAGLARARTEGKHLGRPQIKIDYSKVKFFMDRGLSEHAAFRACGYKRTTFYRWKRINKDKIAVDQVNITRKQETIKKVVDVVSPVISEAI